MKNLKNPSQQVMFDPFEGVIGKTGWKHIASNWQGLFRHAILEKLPAMQLGDDLSDDLGRPSAELYAMCGLLLIREFNDWTVPQAHEAVLFRSDVQYALNLEPGFEISQRTIERYIARLYDDQSLAANIFTSITDFLVKTLEISVQKQRLDSTHVLSDMATFGRTRMMGVAIKRFLASVRKYDESIYRHLPEALRRRYDAVSDAQVFGGAKTPETRLLVRRQAAEDLHEVLEHFAAHDSIRQWKKYQQLQKMFGQQCEIVEGQIKIKVKTGGDVLQNVSDPDATYSGNKGQGYQVQICETCDDENDVNLILAARVETAVQSDSAAVEPVLEDLAERDSLPEQLLADAGYGGDGNVEFAKKKGVELVSPVPGSAKYDPEKIGYDQFTINASHVVEACPAGHAPKSSQYNEASDRLAVTMDFDICSACPLRDRCLVKLHQGKKSSSANVHFKMFEHRAGKRRVVEQTDAFREKYRLRSGIEGVNECVKRRLGVRRLRVRGRPAVTATLLLKLVGWNILRAATSCKIRALIGLIMHNNGDLGKLGAITLRISALVRHQTLTAATETQLAA